jgi:hypothetical protein
VDTRTNAPVPIDPFGVFVGRRDAYGKAPWSKVLSRMRGSPGACISLSLYYSLSVSV